jgi:HK97 family phage portal protein
VGAKPPSVFEGGEGLNHETAQKAAESFAEQVKKGIIPIAFGGLKYKNIMMSAGDLQLFEMKGITTADIYGMFRMPQSKGGNYSREAGATYNNVEQQNINFVQDVVIPSTSQKENECNIKLLRRDEYETHNIYFDLSELLKADLKTMTEHLKEGWGRGWYSANKVLQKLGENPIEGKHGDRFYVQAGFIPADKVDQFLDKKEPKPKKLNGIHYEN